MSHPDLELLGIMGLADADRLGYMMKDKGVTIEKLFNKATCSSGSCGASVEVWYYKEDKQLVLRTLEEHRELQLSHLGVESDIESSVYDPSKETAICPACGHEFSTTNTECPDCGLNFL